MIGRFSVIVFFLVSGAGPGGSAVGVSLKANKKQPKYQVLLQCQPML